MLNKIKIKVKPFGRIISILTSGLALFLLAFGASTVSNDTVSGKLSTISNYFSSIILPQALADPLDYYMGTRYMPQYAQDNNWNNPAASKDNDNQAQTTQSASSGSGGGSSAGEGNSNSQSQGSSHNNQESTSNNGQDNSSGNNQNEGDNGNTGNNGNTSVTNPKDFVDFVIGVEHQGEEAGGDKPNGSLHYYSGSLASTYVEQKQPKTMSSPKFKEDKSSLSTAVNALTALLRSKGVKVDEKEVESYLSKVKLGDKSELFAKLAEAARHFGLKKYETVSFKDKLSLFRPSYQWALNDVFIAHLKVDGKSHYVTVVKITANSITYIDNNKVKSASAKEFLSQWDGNAIVEKRFTSVYRRSYELPYSSPTRGGGRRRDNGGSSGGDPYAPSPGNVTIIYQDAQGNEHQEEVPADQAESRSNELAAQGNTVLGLDYGGDAGTNSDDKVTGSAKVKYPDGSTVGFTNVSLDGKGVQSVVQGAVDGKYSDVVLNFGGGNRLMLGEYDPETDSGEIRDSHGNVVGHYHADGTYDLNGQTGRWKPEDTTPQQTTQSTQTLESSSSNLQYLVGVLKGATIGSEIANGGSVRATPSSDASFDPSDAQEAGFLAGFIGALGALVEGDTASSGGSGYSGGSADSGSTSGGAAARSSSADLSNVSPAAIMAGISQALANAGVTPPSSSD